MLGQFHGFLPRSRETLGTRLARGIIVNIIVVTLGNWLGLIRPLGGIVDIMLSQAQVKSNQIKCLSDVLKIREPGQKTLRMCRIKANALTLCRNNPPLTTMVQPLHKELNL